MIYIRRVLSQEKLLSKKTAPLHWLRSSDVAPVSPLKLHPSALGCLVCPFLLSCFSEDQCLLTYLFLTIPHCVLSVFWAVFPSILSPGTFALGDCHPVGPSFLFCLQHDLDQDPLLLPLASFLRQQQEAPMLLRGQRLRVGSATVLDHHSSLSSLRQGLLQRQTVLVILCLLVFLPPFLHNRLF